jgi:antitoxin component of MazEF toxin-antitoxin module
MITRLTKWGNSKGIRLPKPYIVSLGLKTNDIVDVSMEDDRIIVQKSVRYRHKTLRERAEEFYGKDFEAVLRENTYEFAEAGSGGKAGAEQW